MRIEALKCLKMHLHTIFVQGDEMTPLMDYDFDAGIFLKYVCNDDPHHVCRTVG
jgi:hypothetical protein